MPFVHPILKFRGRMGQSFFMTFKSPVVVAQLVRAIPKLIISQSGYVGPPYPGLACRSQN